MKASIKDFEIMAPVGSRESLAAAIQAGADSIYFGIESLNMRARSASINIPQKLHEINVKEEDIPALAVAAFNDVCTGGNPRPTSVADIEALYRKAF